MGNSEKAVRKSITLLVVTGMLCLPSVGCFATRGPLQSGTTGSATIDTTGDTTSGITLPGTKLGDISFTEDKDRSVSGDYPADGTDFTISCTDAQGYVWRLDIPGNALLFAKTITMTPLTDIKSITFPAEVSGGVLLAPDGLRFLSDARITVTHPDKEVGGLLFSGSHDGTGLEFMAVEAISGGVSATVRHFSSVAQSEGNQQRGSPSDPIARKAEEQRQDAIKEAKGLIKEPLEIPTPPSITLECLPKRMSEGKDAKSNPLVSEIMEYIDELGEPEEEVYEKLASAGSAYSRYTGRSTYSEDKKWLQLLAGRLAKKVETLSNKYAKDPEKYLAVGRAFITYSRVASVVNVMPPPFSLLYPLQKKTIEHCLEQIEKNHDFRYMRSVIMVSRESALLGASDADVPGLDEIIKRLQKIMKFTIIYQLTYKTDDTDIRIEGVGNIAFTDFGMPYMSGKGTTKYVSTKVTFSKNLYEIKTTFPVKLMMDLDACDEKQVTLLMDRLGAQEETHAVLDNGEWVKTRLPGIVELAASNMSETDWERQTVLFPGDSDTVTAYVFYAALQNKEVEIAEESYDGEMEGADITVSIQIEHTTGK